MKLKRTICAAFLTIIFAITPFVAGGCEVEVVSDNGDDDLYNAITAIAIGVVDIVDYFD